MMFNRFKCLVAPIASFMLFDAIGATWETGSLTVVMSDVDGNLITNATLVVSATKGGIGGHGGASDYNFYQARTDMNGAATVDFKFCSNHFEWYVITPSHYRPLLSQDEFFKCTVVNSDYLYLDTNTVDGLAKYQELKALDKAGDYVSLTNFMAKFEPKSVTYGNTHLERALCLYPKRNPQPMFAHYSLEAWRDLRLPMAQTTVASNSVAAIKNYDVVDFDMEVARFLPPWGGRNDSIPGKVSDFRIVRSECVTNGVVVQSGYLEFGPGCGAYKGIIQGDLTFQGLYAADVNASYARRIPFERRQVNGVWTNTVPLLRENEFLVCRTRAVMDEEGSVTNCNYATMIRGVGFPWKKMTFDQLIFNPRPNDPNLEYDGHTNLADK